MSTTVAEVRVQARPGVAVATGTDVASIAVGRDTYRPAPSARFVEAPGVVSLVTVTVG